MGNSFSRTAVVGIAVLVWSTAASSAPRGGHGGHGGGAHFGGGHAVAHVGSVHFAGRLAFERAPIAHGGAVRAEHYAHVEHFGQVGHPYRADYMRHFWPGYESLWIGDVPYYYYAALPPGCVPEVINGTTYYVLNGVYYQPYIYGGQTVYLIAPT